MTSVQSAGYFDQSDKMIKMILAVVTATGTVMLPHVANAFMKGEVEKTKQFLYNSFSFVTALSVPMMFGIAAISRKFVPLFFTDKFLAVTPLMMIESVVILLIAWSNALGTQYLLPTNQNGAFTKSVVLGAVVNIIVNIPFIMLWGAFGATVSTVLSELTVTAYQLIAVKNQINYSNLFADTGKYLLSGFIMFCIIYEVDSLLAQTWMMLLLEVLLGIMIYITLLVIWRAGVIKIAKDFLKKNR
jgi:O-antigen/teichoic acid export membrane protein